MSNEIAKNDVAEHGLSAYAHDDNPFATVAREHGVKAGAFLTFSGNTGVWTFKGQEVEAGTVLAFNIPALSHGWICWKGKRPVGEYMTPFEIPMKPEGELEDHGPYKEGEGWARQVGCPVRDLAGGEQMQFNIANLSGWNSMWRLAEEYGVKRKFNLDDKKEYKVPLIEIGSQGFESAKAAGTKYAPTLKIVDWASNDELANIAANAGEVDSSQHEPSAPVEKAAPAAKPMQRPTPSFRATGQRT